jgi:Spy/CpxP family protein refolding chaperone
MSKKQTILIIIILAAAFIAGWMIYTRIIPSKNQNTQISYTPPGNKAETVPSNTPNGPGFRRMVRVLELSPEQIEAFSEIEARYRKQMATYTRQLDSIDLTILEEIKKENPDREKLDSLAAKTGEIQYALKKATTDHFLQVKTLCTHTQREKFNNVISDIDRFRRGQRQGPGRGQGRQPGRGQRGPRNR